MADPLLWNRSNEPSNGSRVRAGYLVVGAQSRALLRSGGQQLARAVRHRPRLQLAGIRRLDAHSTSAYSGLCSGRVALFPGSCQLARRTSAVRSWVGATSRLPMGVARPVGAAADQPGSRRSIGSGVARRDGGEGACDGEGWRIGRRRCVAGGWVEVVRHKIPIMTRRRPCCR